MSQYLIFLTDGIEESCCLITSQEDNARQKLNSFKEIVKRDNAWFELREYKDSTTNEYVVLNT